MTYEYEDAHYDDGYRDGMQRMREVGHARIKELEAKLAGGVIAEYDDGSTIFLSGYAGGAADGGAWSTLTLMEKAPDGTLREREYKAQGDWRATLAEIKGESHDPL